MLGRRNQDLEHRLRQHFGEHITQVHLKMADTPAGALPPCCAKAMTWHGSSQPSRLRGSHAPRAQQAWALSLGF